AGCKPRSGDVMIYETLNSCAIVRSWRFGRPEFMTIGDTFATVQIWAYRLGGFALLNIMDDPAWLALMFC
ncbi:MAG: hypothetical protein ABJA49_07375, partial [Betaproteobacteria bacterium]